LAELPKPLPWLSGSKMNQLIYLINHHKPISDSIVQHWKAIWENY